MLKNEIFIKINLLKNIKKIKNYYNKINLYKFYYIFIILNFIFFKKD